MRGDSEESARCSSAMMRSGEASAARPFALAAWPTMRCIICFVLTGIWHICTTRSTVASCKIVSDMGADLPRQAEIVVIGGGIIGCSTAYRLAKLGKRDVVLLERSKLGSGTTWHSAAMVRQLRSTNSLTQLVRYS